METDTAGRAGMSPARSATTLRGTGRGVSAVTALEPTQAVAAASAATDSHNDQSQQGLSRWSMGAGVRAALMRVMEQRTSRIPRRANDRVLQRARAYDRTSESAQNPDDDLPHTDIQT
ncbi:MAG: hypothetical protein J0H17_22870 [Rhizobiales bacterium]|nr:hypothetical protein [Hyphomicrobiales bacterium]